MIDWGLARRVAAIAAGEGPAVGDERALRDAVEVATEAVLAYTEIEPEQPLPAGEWVSRREWAAINLESMRGPLALLERRLERELSLPGRLTAPVSGLTGRVAAVEAGGLIGYAARRVIGQYEYAVLDPGDPPRLLFVDANVDAARRQLGAEPAQLLRWIALHEVTHAVHLAAVPWLRAHLAGLASTLLGEARLKVDAAGALAAARRTLSTDPRRTLARLGASDPLTILAAPEARETIAALQATMAVIEGYAEHVMDAAAPALVGAVGPLREAIERRRELRSLLGRLLGWALGIELKLRQYRDGKRFVDAVVATGGSAALAPAWRGPEQLPNLAELHDSGAWLRRVGVAAAA